MSSLLEPETMPLESHLAAIVILLSASALRGPTAVKAAALCAHLEAVAHAQQLAPHLRGALQQVLVAWRSAACDAQTTAGGDCPYANAGVLLH